MLSREAFTALNRLLAVPMFTMGMSRNLVRMSPISESIVLTSIMQDLSVLSLDSSIRMENGLTAVLLIP